MSKQLVFLNGKFLTPEEARVSVLEPGFLYGWGLFETMRSYKGNIVYFDKHLERIRESSQKIAIQCPYSLNKLKNIIQETIKLNNLSDAYVRLTLWKKDQGADALVIVKRHHPYSLGKYKNGFSACISSYRQAEGSFLANLKTTNYLLPRLAFLEAQKKEFDEAIILNNKGNISEGTRSNIFLVKNKEIFTPSLESGCLDGVTRRLILDLARKNKIKSYEGSYVLKDLYGADGVFLTNSLMGIVPLVHVTKKAIADGKVDSLTNFFIQQYNLLLKNGT